MDFRVNENRIFKDVNTVIKTFPDGFKVTRYHGKLKVREKGWEEHSDSDLSSLETQKLKIATFGKSDKLELSRIDNLQRTKSQVMDLVRCNLNDWKSFVTLTFKDNVTDLTYANRMFSNWTRSIRRVYPDFKYLGVPELQERGAWHYHLFTNLVPGSTLCPHQSGKDNMYDVKYWHHGFSSVFDLNCTDVNFRADKYICKYMLKDYERAVLYGRNRFLRSNNLQEADKTSVCLSDSEFEALKSHLLKDAKDVKEKTVISSNRYCPNFEIIDIISEI